MTRTILFGGSFDPIHLGHLCAAESALTLLPAAEAWFIPAAISPGRRPVAAGEIRRAMVELALSGHPRLQLMDYELNKAGPSYTYDTWTHCRTMYPNREFWWVVGAEVALHINDWHRSAELLNEVNFAIVSRAGHPRVSDDQLQDLGFQPARYRRLAADCPDISSTDVRRRAAAGQPLAGLVPKPVEDLIVKEGLYRAAVP